METTYLCNQIFIEMQILIPTILKKNSKYTPVWSWVNIIYNVYGYKHIHHIHIRIVNVYGISIKISIAQPLKIL